MEKKWIALFSQTGSEIVAVSKQLNRHPDIILTNNTKIIHSELTGKAVVKSHEEIIAFLRSISSNCIVTLHGYLRIIPDSVIRNIPEIYNLHPGDIVSYPELIGKDPQKKAIDLQLPKTGVIIHQVTTNLDQGPIIDRQVVKISTKDLDMLINQLKIISVDMWVKFLKGKI